MTTPANDVDAHIAEIQLRTAALLDGVEAFLPLATALTRELSRADEDIVRLKRRETDEQVLGMAEGMVQRHRALHASTQDLQRQVEKLFVIAHELEGLQAPFRAAVARKGAPVSPGASP